MIPSTIRRIAGIASLLGLAALTSAAQDSAPAGARLFDLTTARAIIDEKPSEPTRLFRPDDETIYLWYAAEGCADGMTIRSVWSYLETDPPLQFADSAVTVDREGTWGQFNFRLTPGHTWSIGRYRIELLIGDKVVAESGFRVVSADTIRTVTLTPGAGDDRPRVPRRF